MKVIVDRLEGDYVVVELEIGDVIHVPSLLFPNVKEGDVVRIEIDQMETERRKEKIEKMVNDIFVDES